MNRNKQITRCFNETLVALTIGCSHDQNVYAFLLTDSNYMEFIDTMIRWATDFEKTWAKTNWLTDDWYDAIDSWIEESLEELGYDKEETYSLT